MDVSVKLPEITGRERPVRRAGAPGEPLHVSAGGTQTVLVRCTSRDDPDKEDDEWSRALVIVLDGPPVKGAIIEVSPANGRLIENSAWRPAREPYAGLEGKITIVSVTNQRVVADCSVRNIIKQSGDPVHSLRGEYEFEISPFADATLAECAILMEGGKPGQPTEKADKGK